MSDNDLIRRGDALYAIAGWEIPSTAIAALPAVTPDPDLSDPVTVHANMLRGTIAKPTVEQIVHLYGREAFQPMIDAAIARALEKACLAVSEHADWPEDEHGRTEQVGLFARVINAIRAITPAAALAVPEVQALTVGKAALEHMLDRRGISGVLEQIRDEDPEVWQEICEETGRAALAALRGEVQG